MTGYSSFLYRLSGHLGYIIGLFEWETQLTWDIMTRCDEVSDGEFGKHICQVWCDWHLVASNLCRVRLQHGGAFPSVPISRFRECEVLHFRSQRESKIIFCRLAVFSWFKQWGYNPDVNFFLWGSLRRWFGCQHARDVRITRCDHMKSFLYLLRLNCSRAATKKQPPNAVNCGA